MAATVQSKGSGGGAPPSYVKTPASWFIVSLPVDRRLARYDIAGSLAHVEMLAAVGIVSKGEAELLGKGLRGVYEGIASGRSGRSSTPLGVGTTKLRSTNACSYARRSSPCGKGSWDSSSPSSTLPKHTRTPPCPATPTFSGRNR